jgi:hypothetical protein
MQKRNLMLLKQGLGKIWDLRHSQVKLVKTGGGYELTLHTNQWSQSRQEETVLFLSNQFPQKLIYFCGCREGKVFFSVRPQKTALILSD